MGQDKVTHLLRHTFSADTEGEWPALVNVIFLGGDTMLGSVGGKVQAGDFVRRRTGVLFTPQSALTRSFSWTASQTEGNPIEGNPQVVGVVRRRTGFIFNPAGVPYDGFPCTLSASERELSLCGVFNAANGLRTLVKAGDL
jgi:hypothetical protein